MDAARDALNLAWILDEARKDEEFREWALKEVREVKKTIFCQCAHQ